MGTSGNYSHVSLAGMAWAPSPPAQVKIAGAVSPNTTLSWAAPSAEEKDLIKTLDKLKYEKPYPIQEQAIPAVISGKDVLGIAKTGSGKTASYVLPILHQLLEPAARRNTDNNGPSILVLVPTRELAIQVNAVFQDFITQLSDRIKSLAVFGGVSINPQMQAIRNVDVLVATPGRLIELEEKNATKLSSVSNLVLDEADKMLNLGFKEEVDKIIALLPKKRQNLLFSATLSDDLNSINQLILDEPTVIKIASEQDSIDLIHQRAYQVETDKKGPFLRELIKKEDLKQTLIFVSSAYQADHVADKLRRNKIQAESIHGKLSQGTRRETLEDFKSGKLRILVATDLLSRGVDIDSLPCVINYELPDTPDNYVHRIGRTARAGREGEAIAFCSAEEVDLLVQIEKVMKMSIPVASGTRPEAVKAEKPQRGGRRRGGGGGGGRPHGGGGGGNRKPQGAGGPGGKARKPRRPRRSKAA